MVLYVFVFVSVYVLFALYISRDDIKLGLGR